MKRRKRRIMAILLAIAMIFTMVDPSIFGGAITVQAEGSPASNVQNGWTDETHKTYNITSESDMLAISEFCNEGVAEYLEANYILHKPLDFTGDTYHNKINIGSSEHHFKGTFDGQGYSITGLWGDAQTAVNNGLFGVMDGATVKNLIIKGADYRSNQYGGILAAQAKNSTIQNVTIIDSSCKVASLGAIVGLITTGGLYGGALIGYADNTKIYNCESRGTEVYVDTTGGVQALGGDGMYMGGLVGWMDNGSILEYSRVVGGEVSTEYYVAVGALAANMIYAGGLVGRIDGSDTTTQVLDCFSSADVNYDGQCYVSVGAGLSGYAGGIAARISGENYKMERCHFAGNLSGYLLNSILVLPIIGMQDYYLGGVAGQVDNLGGIQNCYFNWENATKGNEYPGGPKVPAVWGESNNGTMNAIGEDQYTNPTFFVNFDFDGTVMRETGNNEPFDVGHPNKWVIDPANKMPVHGSAVQAEIDFPGAGTISFAATSIQGEQKTNGLSDGPSELANGTTITQIAQTHAEMNEELTLTATVEPGYNFEGWYLRRDGVETAILVEQYGSQQENYKLVLGGDSESSYDYKDGDVFIARYTADVVFEKLDGEAFETEQCTYNQIVNTSSKVPSESGYIFLGWSLEKLPDDLNSENLDSTKIDQITTWTEDNITITKTMHLYPVFIRIEKYNVNVQMQSAPQKEGEAAYIKEATGSEGTAKICTDENGNIYITVEHVDETGKSIEGINEENGYRFSGWYEISENGESKLVSKSKDYYLTYIDLKQPHRYEARYQYRVRTYIPVRAELGNLKYILEPSSTSHFGDFYVDYDVSINDNGVIPKPGFYESKIKFVYWTNDVDNDWKEGKTIQWGSSVTHIGGMEAKAYEFKFQEGQPVINVTAPMEVYGIVTWTGSPLEPYRPVIAQADFPSAMEKIFVTSATEGSLDVTFALKDGYNFRGFIEYTSDNYGESWTVRDSVPDPNASEEKNKQDIDAIKENSSIHTEWGYDKDFDTVLMTQITADINMYSLNDNDELDSTTLERKYNSLLFNPVNADGTIAENGNTEDWDQISTNKYDTPYYTMPNDRPVGVGNTKSDKEMYRKNYQFIGWMELTDESAMDVFNTTDLKEIATKKFVTTNRASVDGYLLYKAGEENTFRVTETMNICPVYDSYNVTFETNFEKSEVEGVPEITDYTMTNDGEITITPPSVDGYEFQEWEIISDNGINPTLTENENGSYTFKVETGPNYTVTAIYKAEIAFIGAKINEEGKIDNRIEEYLCNQPIITGINELPVPYISVNEEKEINMSAPSSGSVNAFVGWKEYDFGSTKLESAAEIYPDLSEDVLKSLISESYLVTGAKDMRPVYTGVQIKLNSNIGAKSKATINISKEGIVTLNAPEQEGYVFTGWLLNNNAFVEVDSYTLSPEELHNSEIYQFTANYDPVVTYKIPTIITDEEGNNNWNGEYTDMELSIPYGEPIGDGQYSVAPTIAAVSALEKVGYIFGGWTGEEDGKTEYDLEINKPITLYPLTSQAKLTVHSNIDNTATTITVNQESGTIKFPGEPSELSSSKEKLPEGISETSKGNSKVEISFIGYSLVEITTDENNQETGRTSKALYKVGDTISAKDLSAYNSTGNYRIYAVWSQIQNIQEASIYLNEENSHDGLCTAAAVNTKILRNAGLQDSESKYERHILYSKNSKYTDVKTENGTDWNNTLYQQYFDKDYDIEDENWDVYVSLLYNIKDNTQKYGVCPYLKFFYTSDKEGNFRDKIDPTWEHNLKDVANNLWNKKDKESYYWYNNYSGLIKSYGEIK